MPGIFDFLGGLFGGGGDNVDPANIVSDVPGLVNTPDYLNSVGNFFNGGGPIPLDFGTFSNSFGGGDGSGAPIDWGSTTPFSATALPTAEPANILTNIPGLTPTGAGGGIGSSLPGILNGVGPQVLRGLGGGGGSPQPQGAPAARPGVAPTAGGGTPAQGGVTGVPGAAGGGGIPGLLGNLTGGIGGLGGLGTLTSGIGLIGSLLKGDKLPPQADQLTSLANTLGDQAKNQVMPTALANQQGFINDQALGRVNRTLQQNESSIRDSYARMGMSGSTMEAEDLQNARQSADQEVFQLGQTMATTGLQTAMQMFGDQSSIMQELMQAQIEQDKALSDAIASFADAAVYGARDPQPAQGSPAGAGGAGGGLAGLGSTIGAGAGGAGAGALGALGSTLGAVGSGVGDALGGLGGTTPLPEPATVAPPVQPATPPDFSGLINTPGLLDQIGALLG